MNSWMRSRPGGARYGVRPGGVVAERARGSERAAELLGARLIHVDLEDTSVSEGASTISAIHRVLDETGATTVYTHTSRDVHQDHRNVHSATLVAARGIPRVYCYQAPSTTVEFKPTKFVAIDPYVDRKLEVIRAFASQTAVRSYLDEELMRSTARYWSRFGVGRYVEPLEVVRPVVHVDDLGDLFVAAIERASPGAILHGVGETVLSSDVAAAADRAAGGSGRAEAWPVEAAAVELGERYAANLALDQVLSSTRTRSSMDWQPRRPGLVADLTG